MSSSLLQTKFNQEKVVAESRKSLVIKQAEDSSTLSTESPSTIHIELPRQGWINFSEGYLSSTMKVHVATAATTNGSKPGSMSLFKSVRVIIGGVPMENISDVHVLARMLNETSMDNDSASAGQWALGHNRSTINAGIVDAALQVAGGGSRVCYKVPSGILNYDGLYPLHLSSPVVIELEMNSTTEALLCGTYAAGDKIEIANVSYNASIYDVPREFNDAAVAATRSGEGFQFFVPTWSSTSHNTVASTDQSFNVTNNARSAKNVLFCQRLATNLNDATLDYSFVRNNIDTIAAEIGTSVYPNKALQTEAESYIELQKARGYDISKALTRGNITKEAYHAQTALSATLGGKAFYGFNLEKFVTDTEVTGTDLANNPLKITVKGTSAVTANNKMYFYIEREGIMSIRAAGDVTYTV